MSNKPRYERLKKKWAEQAMGWELEQLKEIIGSAYHELERMWASAYYTDRECDKQEAYVLTLDSVLAERLLKIDEYGLEGPI